MFFKKKFYLFFLFCLMITVFVGPARAEDLYKPQFSISGTIGEDMIGKASILYPVTQDENSLFYGDIRSMVNGNISELNLGLGYRKLLDNKDVILGAYLFRDRRKELGYYWNQWTVGTEFTTGRYSLSINGYLPDDERFLVQSQVDDVVLIDGNEIGYQEADLNTYAKAMQGYDIELGTEITNLPFNLMVYYKHFAFSREGVEGLEGNALRLETSVDNENGPDKWTFGLDWQDDNIRGSRVLGTIGYQIPLGSSDKTKAAGDKNNLTTLEKKMTDFTHRDIDVIVKKQKQLRKVKKKCQAVNPSNDEVAGNIWFVTADGTGAGTKDDPTSLAELGDSGEGDEIVAQKNDVIVLLGDAGDIETGGFHLLEGQKLLSAGGFLKLDSSETEGRFAVYRPEGKQATLINDETLTDILYLADDTTVSGVKFDGKNKAHRAILGENIAGDININNNTIVDVAGGINIISSNLHNVIINDNTVEGVDMMAISVDTHPMALDSLSSAADTETGSFNIEISGNIINNVGSDIADLSAMLLFPSSGIGVFNDSNRPTNIKVTDNQLGEISNGLSAIFVDSRVSSEPLVLRSASDSNAQPENNITVSNNTIDAAEHSGILVNSSSDSENDDITTISNNTIGDAGDNGINVSSNAAGVNVLDNEIGSVDGDGIHYGNNFMSIGPDAVDVDIPVENTVLTVSGNTIENAGYNGISLELNAAKVDILGNTIGTVGSDGIYYGNGVMRIDSTAVGVDTPVENSVLTVSGNIIENANGNGISLYSNIGSIIDATIRSNIIDSAADGIYLFTDEGSVVNAEINDNTFAAGIDPEIEAEGAGTVNFTGNQKP